MNFKAVLVYHTYNQGNKRRRLFFSYKNYRYFKEKIAFYIKPYCDIIAYCLMPNHFHLMVSINHTELPASTTTPGHSSKGMTQSQTLTAQKTLTQRQNAGAVRSLNDSIGIMLRSYTRAINKQHGFSGALFRKATKAICLNCPDGLSPSWYIDKGITTYFIGETEISYPKICFNYIHQNPVKAALVNYETDWEFSSAAFYKNNKKDQLITAGVANNLM